MKRLQNFLVLVVFLGFVSISYAQEQKPTMSAETKAKHLDKDFHPSQSAVEAVGVAGDVNFNFTQSQWNTSVIPLIKSHHYSDEVKQEKMLKTQMKLQNPVIPGTESVFGQTNKTNAVTPNLNTSFQTNTFNGWTPPDNHIAISNGGKIVSVSNSQITIYTTGGSQLGSQAYVDFFSSFNMNHALYDPRVVYDPVEDRFIMVLLHGNSPSTSEVVVCFSKSNAPDTDGWWVYRLNGNLTGNVWFDYPSIGISQNELYITGNLFDGSNVFSEAAILQIDKSAGYSGSTLNKKTWTGISSAPFTLVPLSYGQQGSYGPGTYFVCTRSQKVYLYDLTADLGNNPSLQRYETSTSYSTPGDAEQKNTSVLLDCGDNRILSGFYMNGVIHYVHNDEYASGYSGFRYSRLTVGTMGLQSNKYGASGYDYTYPSVASASSDPSNKTVIIAFLRSNNAIFPQLRAITVDDDFTFSSSLLVKDGEDYVDISTSGGVTRWGDYTGACRKFNTNQVWVSGGYGALENISSNNYHALNTYVGQLTDAGGSGPTGIEDIFNAENTKIYPNPVYDMFYIDFDLEKKTELSIEVLDINGKLVKYLYEGAVKSGKNRLQFNKGALNSGIYIVNIKSGNQILKYEKIVIAN